LGEFAKAKGDYDKVLQTQPDNLSALYQRAWINIDLQDYKSAEEDCTLLISKDPQFYDAYYTRGRAYMLSGDNQRAEKDFQEVVKNAPDPELVKGAQEMLKQLAPK
jgi:tetratricopeptide (TPR) repeat protein